MLWRGRLARQTGHNRAARQMFRRETDAGCNAHQQPDTEQRSRVLPAVVLALVSPSLFPCRLTGPSGSVFVLFEPAERKAVTME